MKRLLLLIAVSIVWSGSVLQAQEYEYVPLVREGIEWGYKNGEIYRFIGEEIINGKVYKQLGNSSRDYPDSYKIAGYAREENKVVYRLYSKDAEEVPIYDFNVKQVGDIMQAWHTEPGVFRHESRKPRFYFSKREIQENDKTGKPKRRMYRGNRKYRNRI